MDFDKDYEGFIDPTQDELAQIADAFKFFPNED